MLYRTRLMWLWTQRYVLLLQLVLFIFMSIFVVVQPVDALVRLGDRSLMLGTSEAGATTTYTISFYFTTPANIGSIDMLACHDPIPYEPCFFPAGLDFSNAVLSNQTGETGFTIASKNANHILLTRPPSMTGPDYATYTFSGVHNPTDITQSFGLRLSTYESTDGSGPVVNLGSVITEATNSITLETQVPPILVFCVAASVADNCTSTDGGNYYDMGDMRSDEPLMALSQFSVGTNASQGYSVTVNGTTMAAGTHVIPAPASPVPSAPGNNQFGLNLRQNSELGLGADPVGDSTNTVVASNYDVPNRYMYKDGDIVASAPNVSLMKKYTVSYIVNSSPDLRAGIYTTTLTYVCTANF